MPGRVILGDYTFEIGPRNQIDFTGPRSISKLDIPGTSPKYQDMGEDEHTIAWAGALSGDNAQADCQKIDGLRKAGKEMKFISGSYNRTVRIKEFNHSDIREDYIVYSITLIEIQHQVIKEKPEAGSTTTPETGGGTVTDALSDYTAYTVKKGDTLWGIAQKYLKNGNRWPEIAKDNNVSDPRKLQIGKVLKIRTGGGVSLV